MRVEDVKMGFYSDQILNIISFDNVILCGKLSLPYGEKDVEKLVIYVNGSGANTFDNKRPGFNYFDLFREQFAKQGVAFFSYNTRGCKLGNNPPMYVDIDYKQYQTYLPLNSVEDLYYMIKSLKGVNRLNNCKIYLLGWSEGTVIATLFAKKYPALVNGLLLAGYVNQNMRDVLTWQNDGSSSMVWYRTYFETDESGRISRQAYEADPHHVVASVLQGSSFDDIDINHDGFISKEDLSVIVSNSLGYTLEKLLDVINAHDDDWLQKNYSRGLIPLTSNWFLQHFSLRSNSEVMPLLDLPIHIFHGTLDQNVDVMEVYKIDNVFKSIGKTNFVIHIFENHNHDLNYGEYIIKKEIPEGIKAIFDCIADF